MIDVVTVTYCRAGGIDLQRAAADFLHRPTAVSNMALITGLQDSEPVVVLRAADLFAHEALARYADAAMTVATPDQARALRACLDEFDRYQASHRDLLALHVPGEVNT